MPNLTQKQQEQLIDNYREFADNIKNIDKKLSDADYRKKVQHHYDMLIGRNSIFFNEVDKTL